MERSACNILNKSGYAFYTINIYCIAYYIPSVCSARVKNLNSFYKDFFIMIHTK